MGTVQIKNGFHKEFVAENREESAFDERERETRTGRNEDKTWFR